MFSASIFSAKRDLQGVAQWLGILLLAITLPWSAGCIDSESQPPTHHVPELICKTCNAAIPLPAGAMFEPSMAVDPTNGLHLVIAAKDGTPTFGLHESWDGGKSWTRHELKVGSAAPTNSFLASVTTTGDPVVAFDLDGTLYVAGLGYHFEYLVEGDLYRRTGASTFVAQSPNGAKDFDGGHVIATGSGTSLGQNLVDIGDVGAISPDWTNHDKEWIAPTADGLAAVWVRIMPVLGLPTADLASGSTDSNTLLFSHSGRDLTTWSQPLEIAVGQPRFPMLLPLSDGRTLITYGMEGTLHQAVVDNGAILHTTEIGSTSGQSFLKAAGSRILLASNDLHENGYQPTLREWDGQESWTVIWQQAPVPTFPNVAFDVDRQGTVWLGWYGGTSESRTYQVVALAVDGTSWTLALDDGMSPIANYGDYVDGVAAAGNSAYFIWPAYRPDSDGRTLEFGELTITNIIEPR